MSREPFVMVPAALLYDPAVPPAAVRLWAILDDCARSAPYVDATRSQLARLVDLEWRQLARLVDVLVAAGWLDVANRGRAGGRYSLRRRARPTALVVENLCTTRR